MALPDEALRARARAQAEAELAAEASAQALPGDDIRARARAQAEAELAAEEAAVATSMQRSALGPIPSPGQAPGGPGYRPSPHTRNQDPLGPDYDKGYLNAAYQGITEAIPTGLGMLKDTYNFAMPFDALAFGDQPSGWYDTLSRTSPEQIAKVTGTIASGTAGAAALAPTLAGYGMLTGNPLIGAAAGVAGGVIGGAAGMMGFDLASDVGTDAVTVSSDALRRGLSGDAKDFAFNATQGGIDGLRESNAIRPSDQYIKDLVYNITQGGVTGLAGAAVAAPIAGLKTVRAYPEQLARTKTLETLNENAPGWYDVASDANPPEGALPAAPGSRAAELQADPYLAYKSLSEITKSDKLKSVERTLPRGDVGIYGEVVERNRVRNTAHLKGLEQIEASRATPEDAQMAIRQGGEAEIAARQRAVDTATDAVTMRVDGLPPEIDTIEGGSQARGVVAEGRDAQRLTVGREFEKVGDSPVDQSHLVSAVTEAEATYFREVGAQPTNELAALIAQAKRLEQPLGELFNGQQIVTKVIRTIKDLQALRSEAIKVIETSDRQTGAVARAVKKGIDDSFEAAVESGQLAPEQLAALRTAISERRIEGTIFEGKRNPNKDVLETNYSGSPATVDSAVLGKYVKPGARSGQREGVRQYKEAARLAGMDHQSAMEPLYRHATDLFRGFALDKDNKVTRKKAEAWLNQYNEFLTEVPELREQFKNVETAQAFLDAKYGDLKRTQAEVEKGATSFWLNVEDPKVAVAKAFSGQDTGKKVKSTTDYLKSKGDKDALAGWRRGIIEYLQEKVYQNTGDVSIEESRLPGGPTFDGRVRDALLASKWLEMEPHLRKAQVFTDSQMKAFDYIFKDKNSQLSIENAKMKGGSDTIQNNSVLGAIYGIASNSFFAGRPVLRFATSIIAKRLKAIPQKQFMETLTKAILDPKFARDLQNVANEKNLMSSAMKLLAESGTIGGAAGPIAAGVEIPEEEAPPAPVTPRKITFTRQRDVTARKSFPTLEELRHPPAPGKLANATPAWTAYADRPMPMGSPVAQQTPEPDVSSILERISTGGQKKKMGDVVDDKILDGVRWVESKNGKYLRSPVGAEGPYQFMPATAAAYKLKDPYHEGDSRRAAKELLNDEYKALGSLELALAAYNTGRPNVLKAVRKAGSKEWNKVAKFLSEETRNYVPQVLGHRPDLLNV